MGVNIPNATLMAIIDADRFGLAQLHQLRGRVIRSSHKPFCFIVSESENEITQKRLKLFKKYNSGFDLAEKDLVLRGAGEFSGTSQSGISDLAMEALKNIKLVEAAQKSAKEILEKDNSLDKYPKIQKLLQRKKVHF